MINRFIKIQKDMYDIAYKEIKNGEKESHWMWFIFPQIEGLGKSYTARYYSIMDKEEAIEYFNNEYLRNNYLQLCNELIKLDKNNPIDIFGDIDSMKLHSSLTLFYIISNNELIHHVLEKYYDGVLDKYTMDKLNYNGLEDLSIIDKIEYLNISKLSYNYIFEHGMLDLLKQMVSSHNDINICLSDLKHCFDNNEIIGYVSLDENYNIKLNKVIDKPINNLVLSIKDEKVNLSNIKENLIYCFNKSEIKDIKGFILG